MKSTPIVYGDIRLQLDFECTVDNKKSGLIKPVWEMTVSVNGRDEDRLEFASQDQFVRFLYAVVELKEQFVCELWADE